MLTPSLPIDEASRLAALRALNVLDTPAEERFDRLTRLAKRLFGVPIALVSLVDAQRQWFKACEGLDVLETPRDISFCGHAILADEVLQVPNALADERFSDNPLVRDDPHIRFYAGCPLKLPDGSKVGTLCVIDRAPRSLDPADLQLLQDLARMAEQELAAVHLATMDELTQLSNRRGFIALAQQAVKLCARLDLPASVLFFDLDDFKSINDRFGHAEGDRALAAFAKLLKQTFRESDVVGRLGGDEFVVLLVRCDQGSTEQALQRLRHAVQAHNRDPGRGYGIRYSVGTLAFNRETHLSIDALLAESDALMYEQKRQRRQA